MDAAIASFGLGLWFGVSAPVAVHTACVLISRHPGAISRSIRFLAAPVGLLGIIGVAAAIGQLSAVDWAGFGMVLGVVVYVVCARLHHKRRTEQVVADGT
jgi:hypothetical protein